MYSPQEAHDDDCTMEILSDKFPDMPIVNTVGLANLELDSEERAPNIVDFAFCIRGAHEGAVYAPSYRRPQCTCGSFDCCLHGFSHACVDDWEECSAYAMFYEILPCVLRLIPRNMAIRCLFYLFVSFLRHRGARPRSPFMKLVLDSHLCEQKNVPRIILHYVLSEEIANVETLPSRQEAIATMLKYYKEVDLYHIIHFSHQGASTSATGSNAPDHDRSE